MLNFGGVMRKLFLGLGLLIVSSSVWAAVPEPVLMNMSGGNYEIQYTGVPNAFYTALQQRSGTSGSWSVVSTYSGIATFTNVSSGTYQYRTTSAYFISGGYEPIDITEFSNPITVTVNSRPVPMLDRPGIQSEYTYRIRTGDINSDGRTDVHIQRLSGGDPDNGVLQETIITQSSDKTFSVLAATSSQLQTGRGWTIRNVKIKNRDFDGDYYNDIMLIDLDDFISGVDNQMIFSYGQPFMQQAKGVKAVDEEFVEFADNLNAWTLNPDFFASALLPSVPAYRIQLKAAVSYCRFIWGFQFCTSSGEQTLFDKSYSLMDLGLENFFGSNTDQKRLARIAVEPDIAAQTNVTAYNTYYCVAVCGYYYVYSFRFAYLYQWWDVWTPTTLGEGFDSQNYDRDAYDISLILGVARNRGNDALTAVQLGELSSILSSVMGLAIPFPGDIPTSIDLPKWLKKIIRASILEAILSAAASWTVEQVNQYRPIFHFTYNKDARKIQMSGLFNPRYSDNVFFTHVLYPNGRVAQEMLALCGSLRNAVISMKQSDLPVLSPVRAVDPKLCPDGSMPRGGGLEQSGPKPITLPADHRIIPIPLDYEE